jgi:hypothetical protein
MTKKTTCQWRYEPYGEFYKTECGNDFVVTNRDNLKDNYFVYCTGCGKKIEEVKEDDTEI